MWQLEKSAILSLPKWPIFEQFEFLNDAAPKNIYKIYKNSATNTRLETPQLQKITSRKFTFRYDSHSKWQTYAKFPIYRDSRTKWKH